MQQSWNVLNKNHGAAAEAMLLNRLRKALDERGTLEVLRVGVDVVKFQSWQASQLRKDIGCHILPRHFPAGGEDERHRRVEVRARNLARWIAKVYLTLHSPHV